MTKRQIIAATLLVLVAASFAFAGLSMESYRQVKAAPVTIVAVGEAGADSTDATAQVNTAVNTRGDPTIAISAELGTASATCVFTVLLWHVDGSTNTLLGTTTATATGGAVYTSTGSAYPANVLLFDSMGATEYEVRHAAPSAGWVSYKAWTYGAHSNPAGN